MGQSPGEITQLLQQLRKGQSDVANQLAPLVYRELYRVASKHMARERPGHPMQPTALVHEAYLRLIDKHDLTFQDRTHFFAVAAREMRRVLVDLARFRHAAKRGGADVQYVSLDDAIVFSKENLVNLLALNEALDRLAALDARQRQIIDLRFFSGLSVEEIAVELNLSPRTIKREWAFARAWLLDQLTSDPKRTRRGR